MRALLLAALASASMVATGCVGSLDTMAPPSPTPTQPGPGSDDPGSTTPPPGSTPGGAPSDTARQTFNTNVYPILAAKCAGCHTVGNALAGAPPFVDATTPNQDPMQAWTTFTNAVSVVGDLSSATNTPLFLTEGKIVHSGNPVFTADEVNTINNWLTLEQQWRSMSGSGTTTVDLLKDFSGCLTKTDFDTANMADAWANNVNTSEGTCKKCHPHGTGYMLATPQDSMFTGIVTYREYMMTYFTVDTTQNKVVVNLAAFETAYHGGLDGQHPGNWRSNGQNADPAGQNNAGVNALNKWYNLAEAKLTATPSQCGTPTLSD